MNRELRTLNQQTTTHRLVLYAAPPELLLLPGDCAAINISRLRRFYIIAERLAISSHNEPRKGDIFLARRLPSDFLAPEERYIEQIQIKIVI